jgi:hypothetical protein
MKTFCAISSLVVALLLDPAAVLLLLAATRTRL